MNPKEKETKDKESWLNDASMHRDGDDSLDGTTNSEEINFSEHN